MRLKSIYICAQLLIMTTYFIGGTANVEAVLEHGPGTTPTTPPLPPVNHANAAKIRLAMQAHEERTRPNLQPTEYGNNLRLLMAQHHAAWNAAVPTTSHPFNYGGPYGYTPQNQNHNTYAPTTTVPTTPSNFNYGSAYGYTPHPTTYYQDPRDWRGIKPAPGSQPGQPISNMLWGLTPEQHSNLIGIMNRAITKVSNNPNLSFHDRAAYNELLVRRINFLNNNNNQNAQFNFNQ